jgi:hypothetical protein
MKDSALFVVRNFGNATLTGSLSIDWPGAMEFSVQPTTVNISPADSARVKVYYEPTNLGTDTAVFRLYTNDPFHSIVTVQLIGNVLLVPILSFDISTFAFGDVPVLKWRDTTVVFSNPGTDTLKVSAINPSDPAFIPFPSAFTLPPGRSITDTIRFMPTLVGAVQGHLLIVSNAATSPDTIRLSGAGTPSVGVERTGSVPDQFSLDQNFPNPFNPSTTISYSVPTTCRVKLQICDVLGQVVADLVDGEQSPGWRSVVWNAQVASGVYFYRMEATSTGEQNKQFMQVKRMLLMK